RSLCIYSLLVAPYTLSLHDALPICFVPQERPTILPANSQQLPGKSPVGRPADRPQWPRPLQPPLLQPGRLPRREACSSSSYQLRSEEHTSELQSRENLVCRLLLDKK